MADSKDDERDEEWFKEVYGKGYTGPPKQPQNNLRDNTIAKKRIGKEKTSAGGSDEDNEPRDLNAIPTDFTSREAKVWEAKAKAIERNWKRRKEEELICRICGNSGHFTQGCPTTLGVNQKSGEVVEKISIRDKRLKPRFIGTGVTTIQSIEKDTGCHLRLEDNLAAGNGAFFVRISGTNRIMVGKAVEGVKKIVDQVDDDRKQQSLRHSQGSYNHGSNASPLIAAQVQHISVQRMQHNPHMQAYHDRAEYDQHAIETIASQKVVHQWEADTKNEPDTISSLGLQGGEVASGARNLSSSQNVEGSGQEETYYGKNPEGRTNKKPPNLKVLDLELGYEQQSFIPQSLEELEHRFMQETMELTKEQNEAEDTENARHRESLREIQERFQQKMAALRAQQAKYREELFRHEAQLRQKQYHQAAGRNRYNYSAGAHLSGFYGGPRDLLGYGTGIDGHHRYGRNYLSHKDGEQYYNARHPYNQISGHDSVDRYTGKQGYDSVPYPPY